MLDGKIDKTVFGIFSTLCGIQKLLYSSEKERTLENILKLHNLIFLHKCLIADVVGLKPSTGTCGSKCQWGSECQVAKLYRFCLTNGVEQCTLNFK